MNKVFLTGALGADPEVRTANDRKVARLRLATSERFRDKTTGERRETTTWHSVSMWSPLAEVAEAYLAKGSRITVVGKIRYNEWTDRDGARRLSTEIEASELEIIKGKAADEAPRPEVPIHPTAQPSGTKADDGFLF